MPASKWPWFIQRLDQGCMLGVHPRTGIPGLWSLRPDQTLGLVFWTKNPSNLLRDVDRLRTYRLVAHITLTGWVEVEKGAPDLDQGVSLLQEALEVLGQDQVVWRFSPVPAVPDVVERFERIARPLVRAGLNEVYVSFLQANDLVPELRGREARQEILRLMSQAVPEICIRLCAEDKTLGGPCPSPSLRYGVCEDGSRFQASLPKEDCGCALAVDPFAINESCTLGCEYCYAADRELSSTKRDTTKGVPL